MQSEPRNFWSRRRAAVEAEALAELEAARLKAEAIEAEALQASTAEKTDEELLADLGLIDPDFMQQGDDFSAFMSRAVPEHLRRRALRKLWLSNPVLANLDGLVDYGDDFTDAATVIPNMQTAYQVGKGMMRHVVALAEKAEAEAKAASEPEQLAADEPAEPFEADELESAPEAEVLPETATESYDDETIQPPRRHMRFAFAS